MKTSRFIVAVSLFIAALPAFATPESDADQVFDWAESAYVNYFPAHVVSASAMGYYYRCYASGLCLGASGGNLYLYDGKQMSLVGTVADYLAMIATNNSQTGTSSATTPKTRNPYEIQIDGSDSFKSSVNSALTLLKQKVPEVYDRVTRNIAIFRQATRSGMRAYDEPPVFEIGDATSTATTTWFASAIAHDATHSMLYHDYLDAHPGATVPDDIWIGKSAEVTCMQYQLSTLKQIGAPDYEVDYLAKLSDGSSNYWDNYGGRFWGM